MIDEELFERLIEEIGKGMERDFCSKAIAENLVGVSNHRIDSVQLEELAQLIHEQRGFLPDAEVASIVMDFFEMEV